MDKSRRSERMVVITQLLLQKPRSLFALSFFSKIFGVAKSTISEDLNILRATSEHWGFGELVTVSGAAGGVKFTPNLSRLERKEFVEYLREELSKPERILPGGYLYMADLIYNPQVVGKAGKLLATIFKDIQPDYIVTVETKGIPLALMTAGAFNVPLVIIRANNKVTEGSALSINYVSGSTRRIQSMSLARRALPTESKVIIIDDFMKAGGTARGMHDLMQEFRAEVLATAVMVATGEPGEKLISNYISILDLISVDTVNRRVIVEPGKWYAALS